MNGLYRACGRPFLNHLAGTAGILVRYGFRAEIVAGALLHSSYSHSPWGPAEEGNEAVCGRLGGRDKPIERRVRAFTERASIWDALGDDRSALATVSVFESEIIAMAAADEVEIYLAAKSATRAGPTP